MDKLDKVRSLPFTCLLSLNSSNAYFPVQMDWEGVKKEMVNDKGLDPAVADRIGAYVKLKGTLSLPLPPVYETRLSYFFGRLQNL